MAFSCVADLTSGKCNKANLHGAVAENDGQHPKQNRVFFLNFIIDNTKKCEVQ